MADLRSYISAANLDTGAGTDYVQRVSLRLSASGGAIEAIGQKVMASSLPVAIASNQSAIPASQSGAWSVSVSGTVTVGSHDVTNAGTFAVQVSSALPAGTNAIGKLASNAGVTIGAVEIASSQTLATVTNVVAIGTSVTPGTSAAHLGKAEDAAHSSGDTGVFALGVRKDTATQLADADGDYAPFIFDSSGRLHVNVGNTVTVGSHAVTNAGTFAVQETGTWIQVDDAAFTPATSKVAMVGAEFDDSTPDSVDEGDGGALRMSANRNLYTTIRDAAGNERGVNVDSSNRLTVAVGNTVTVGSHDVTNAGTFAVQVSSSLPAGTNAIGKLSSNSGVTIGAVEIAASQSVAVTQATASSLNAQVVGPAAHDAAVSGNPLVVGGRASASAPTAVDADGDAVRMWMDRRGAQRVALVDDSGDSVMDGANNAVNVSIVSGGSGNGAILDGADGSIKATVLDYTNANPVAVRLTDTAGDYVAAGAGTQYTEDAAAAANPVGGALVLVRDDARGGSLTTTDGDNVAARGTNAGEMYVKHVDTIPVTQSGTWNVGTLTTITNTVTVQDVAAEASLSVIDDWDESDRAKVNLIVGQAGVQGGSGAVSATTQRVVLATDVALPAGTNAIGKLSANSGVTIGAVEIASSQTVAVTNAGTFVVQENGAALTSLQLIDDVVYTDDTSTHSTGSSKGVLLMGAATPSDGSVNANDIGAVAMTTDRKLHVSVQDALPAGTAAIGKLAANDGVDIGDVTINNSTGASAVNIQDGGNSITVDAPVGTPVNVKVGDGTLTAGVIDETGASAVDALAVGGGTAHDAVDSGNPLKIGGKVSTSIPTAVADADRTNAWFDEYGRLTISDKDTELGLTIGTTGLRDRLFAERMTTLSDSLADGIAGFWTQTTAGGGTITTTGGEGLLKTSTGTTGSSQIVSTNVIYYPGMVAWMNSAVRFGDTGTSGNIRRLGMFTVSGTTPQEGFYFELSGTTLNAVTVKSGTPTATASTSWSRFTQAPFTLDTNYHSFEIRYTANTVWFYVDNVLRHVVSGTSSPLTGSLTLPITATNVKTSGATDITLAIRNIGNGRFGQPGGIVSETGLSAVEALAVGGGTPHDSVDTGNPQKIGGYAKAGTPNWVADGDRVNGWFTNAGALNVADGNGAFRVGNNGTFAVQVNSAVGAGTNLIGAVQVSPRTTGGYSTYHVVSAASTNAASVKGTTGQLFGWHIYNNNSSMRKVALHNMSTVPVGGTNVFLTIPIPGSGGANVMSDVGISFSGGIGITTVTGMADSDASAVSSQDLVINLFYV